MCTKICNACQIEKPTEEFEKIYDSKKNTTTVYSICKKCKYERRALRKKQKREDYLKENPLPEKPVKIKKEPRVYIYTEDGYKDLRKDEKLCKKCGKLKQKEEFVEIKNHKTKVIKQHGHCRKCCNTYRDVKRKNKRVILNSEVGEFHDKRSITQIRNRLIRSSVKDNLNIDYNFVTVDWYEYLLNYQNKCCAICKKTIGEVGKKLFIDHCHTTGKIRGLLCHNCNIGVGGFKDDIGILKSAIEYIENPPHYKLEE